MDKKILSTDRPVAIYYAFISDIESITLIDKTQCSVVLRKGWRKISTTIGTIDLQEESSSTAAGKLFTTDLAATCPGHDTTTMAEIASIIGARPLLLRVDYRSGMKKIIGNTTGGPRLAIKTSSNTTTRRMIQATYKTKSPNRWMV